jgi:hypothetical protein
MSGMARKYGDVLVFGLTMEEFKRHQAQAE